MTTSIDFDNLDFEAFKELALKDGLSIHEKVGFPDEYRDGLESRIFEDILGKLKSLNVQNLIALDIGPGCSNLPIFLSDHCKELGGHCHFVDSKEMLSLLPDAKHLSKWDAKFPECPTLLTSLAGRVNSIIVYSVIQYVFAEGNLWKFLDECLSLLTDGGEILFGDVPNISMRKRFFSSKAGKTLHREFTGADEDPIVEFNTITHDKIDDSVVMSILMRARAQGFQAWVVPQGHGLPMANRREDIIIRKP